MIIALVQKQKHVASIENKSKLFTNKVVLGKKKILLASYQKTQRDDSHQD
jgi:hypothetical protein